MQLASDIAVNLAAACGRFLLRRYLKDATEVRGESLLDIAKRQLTDVRQQGLIRCKSHRRCTSQAREGGGLVSKLRALRSNRSASAD